MLPWLSTYIISHEYTETKCIYTNIMLVFDNSQVWPFIYGIPMLNGTKLKIWHFLASYYSKSIKLDFFYSGGVPSNFNLSKTSHPRPFKYAQAKKLNFCSVSLWHVTFLFLSQNSKFWLFQKNYACLVSINMHKEF